MGKPKLGTVYLVHFERRYHHAGHYLGFTADDNPNARLEEHRNNRGSRLLEVINNAGINWELARVWNRATRSFERRLKKRKEAPRLCPICCPCPKPAPIKTKRRKMVCA